MNSKTTLHSDVYEPLVIKIKEQAEQIRQLTEDNQALGDRCVVVTKEIVNLQDSARSLVAKKEEFKKLVNDYDVLTDEQFSSIVVKDRNIATLLAKVEFLEKKIHHLDRLRSFRPNRRSALGEPTSDSDSNCSFDIAHGAIPRSRRRFD